MKEPKKDPQTKTKIKPFILGRNKLLISKKN